MAKKYNSLRLSELASAAAFIGCFWLANSIIKDLRTGPYYHQTHEVRNASSSQTNSFEGRSIEYSRTNSLGIVITKYGSKDTPAQPSASSLEKKIVSPNNNCGQVKITTSEGVFYLSRDEAMEKYGSIIKGAEDIARSAENVARSAEYVVRFIENVTEPDKETAAERQTKTSKTTTKTPDYPTLRCRQCGLHHGNSPDSWSCPTKRVWDKK